jgi:hypothetical protein
MMMSFPVSQDTQVQTEDLVSRAKEENTSLFLGLAFARAVRPSHTTGNSAARQSQIVCVTQDIQDQMVEVRALYVHILMVTDSISLN